MDWGINLKRKISEKKRSLTVLCVIAFIVYSLILLIVYMTFQYVLDQRMQTVFPTMDDFLEYEEELETEDYLKIPQKRFSNCSYIIFGENGNLIYASNVKIKDMLISDDLDVIIDYAENAYYSVYREKDDSAGVCYLIQKNSYDEETALTRLEEYCIVDENLNILEGSLFSDKEYLTAREFDLIQGFYNADETIEKYSYETKNKEARTLVFISPQFNENTYNSLLLSVRKQWLWIIPVILAGTFIFTILFRKKIKHSTEALNSMILSYRKEGKPVEDKRLVPVEFQPTLDTLKSLLEQLDAAKLENRRIIANISHDLKTPLTVIGGYARAFEGGIIPREDEKRYMECIRQRAELAESLINTLFEYAKMDHPDYKPVWEKTDLCEFTKEFLAEKYSELESAGFELSLSIPERPLKMQMDRGLFRRMLENLINNSMRYNSSGTTIFVVIEEKRNMLQLTIADNGVGIKPEVATTLFKPFVTENKARSVGGGTGLGLSIVKRAVEINRGSIEVVIPPHVPYAAEFKMCFDTNAEITGK